MKISILATIPLLLLAGCAISPWPHYETALRCHLDGKKDECDKEYEKAIALGPKTQGLHASYGVHLLKEGKSVEATREFEIEKANYPEYASRSISQLAQGTSAQAKSPRDSISQ